MSERDWEPGYKAVLIREETKRRLQELRKALPGRTSTRSDAWPPPPSSTASPMPWPGRAFLALVKDIVRLDLETG